MILYSKLDCPLCTVVKTKLQSKDIPFETCTNEEEMKKLNIDRLPVLKTDNGEFLEFSEIIKRLKEDEL